MSVFGKWNSDRLFRSTAERKALYDAYVATRPRVSNITDCVPPAAPLRKNHLSSIGRSNASVYNKAPDADAPAADADATAQAASDDEAEARHRNLRARSGLSYAPKRAPDGVGPRRLQTKCPL